MRQTSGTRKSPGEKIVKEIKRATRKQYSSEEKIRIVLDGLRGEDSIAEVCRREGISQDIASMEMDKLLTEGFPKSEAIDVFKIMSKSDLFNSELLHYRQRIFRNLRQLLNTARIVHTYSRTLRDGPARHGNPRLA